MDTDRKKYKVYFVNNKASSVEKLPWLSSEGHGLQSWVQKRKSDPIVYNWICVEVRNEADAMPAAQRIADGILSR